MMVQRFEDERTAQLVVDELEARGLTRINGHGPLRAGEYRFGREAGAYVVSFHEHEAAGDEATTEDLRALLFHELYELQAGRSDPKRARAAAMLADKIIQAARVEAELQVVAHRFGKSPTPIKLIGGSASKALSEGDE